MWKALQPVFCVFRTPLLQTIKYEAGDVTFVFFVIFWLTTFNLKKTDRSTSVRLLTRMLRPMSFSFPFSHYVLIQVKNSKNIHTPALLPKFPNRMVTRQTDTKNYVSHGNHRGTLRTCFIAEALVIANDSIYVWDISTLQWHCTRFFVKSRAACCFVSPCTRHYDFQTPPNLPVVALDDEY